MQVTEVNSEGLSREFKIVIGADDISSKVDDRISEMASTVQLPGFRPGKVPTSLLRKRYGNAVMGEVLERAVNETSAQALDERGLRPASQPKIEITAFDEGKDLEYSLSVDLMPEITPMDFSGISLERLKAEPGEKEIDESIGRLTAQHKTSEPLKRKRKSREGDTVVINFTGRVDGEAFEGGAAENHNLELGSGSFIPGFEEQLVGVDAGAKLDVAVSFPAEYGQPDLAGKEAVFETEVIEIRESIDPEINDEFAKLFGMEDLAGLREAVKGQLDQEFGIAARARLKRSLLDILEKEHSFDVPPGMAEEEYAAICRQVNPAAQNAAAQNPAAQHDHDHGHDHDHDHAHEETVTPELIAQYKEPAVKALSEELILDQLSRDLDLEVTPEELDQELQNMAKMLGGGGSLAQMKREWEKNGVLARLHSRMKRDKTLNSALEKVTLKEVMVDRKDLIADNK